MAKIDAKEFREERGELQEKIRNADHLGVKRFLNLDTQAYKDGALPGKTLEFMGLVASMVLRCDDCITYHLDQLVTEHKATREELTEAMNVALVVGGSIVIPHFRRAYDALDQLLAEEPGNA
jgi:AhpD family alkylhydroperoxidase